MKIIETNLQFKAMSTRKTTTRIILHHAEATKCFAEDIHRWHLANGWSGAGYHFLVRKDGSIYRLRPEDKVGAHAGGSNSDSIGICFEGKYQEETMPEAQIKAGQELVAYLKQKYGISKVQKHSDVCNTSCPGKNFPFDEIANGTKTNEIHTIVDSTYSHQDFVKEVQSACGAKVDGIPGPETLSKTVTVSKTKNSKHAVVKPIQKYLYAIGYTEVGEADGVAGSKFDKGVKRFQKDHGCVQDGEITARNKTWKKLLKLAQVLYNLT